VGQLTAFETIVSIYNLDWGGDGGLGCLTNSLVASVSHQASEQTGSEIDVDEHYVPLGFPVRAS
jgi:hypothetical protein